MPLGPKRGHNIRRCHTVAGGAIEACKGTLEQLHLRVLHRGCGRRQQCGSCLVRRIEGPPIKANKIL